jgi:hypothetical protein
MICSSGGSERSLEAGLRVSIASWSDKFSYGGRYERKNIED